MLAAVGLLVQEQAALHPLPCTLCTTLHSLPSSTLGWSHSPRALPTTGTGSGRCPRMCHQLPVAW